MGKSNENTEPEELILDLNDLLFQVNRDPDSTNQLVKDFQQKDSYSDWMKEEG